MNYSPVKRACDSCHRRKVKCIGEENKPCKNCVSANLPCTYNAIPQKKGPKGSRAKVLSELRESQRHTNTSPPYDLRSPLSAKTPGLLTKDVGQACVEIYLSHVYCSQPILSRDMLQEYLAAIDTSFESYCLLAAFCAFLLVQPWMESVARHETDSLRPRMTFQTGSALLDEAVRMRRASSHFENPSVISILTSYHISAAYCCLDKQNTAWHYLRDATTQAIILGMDDESFYKEISPIAATMQRDLFWVLFLKERVHALQTHRPLTLQPTISLPSTEESAGPIGGFVKLINLYRPFDNTFFSLWNKTVPACSPAWLIGLQAQISEQLPHYIQSTEFQTVDFHITQQWLRIMVWQLALSQGYISSAAQDNTMCFKYPIEVSQELVDMSRQFSQYAMEINGVGLLEKLFDIACTLADVLAYVPMSQSMDDASPREYLSHLMQLLSSLGGGQNRYFPLLVAKVNETLPQLALPLSQPISAQPSPPTREFRQSSSGSPSGDTACGASPELHSQVGSEASFPGRHHASPVDPHAPPFSAFGAVDRLP